jgi:hypothetical protein
MNQGKTVFSQVMDTLPLHEFRKCVNRYDGNSKIRSFSCLDQFLCMAFAQLTYRESLRDIETCFRSIPTKLYHLGIRGKVSKSTLADANENRDWRIYADFAQILIHIARNLYANDDFGLELEQTVYALDTTTIDLCLSLFPWACFRKTKAAIKLHTLLDLRGNIPSFVEITDGKCHEIRMLDILTPEAGSFYVMDRGFLDFGRLYSLDQAKAFFVIKARSTLNYRRIYSHPIDKNTGLQCDQTIMLKSQGPMRTYPQQLRRIRLYDALKDKRLTFLTNNFSLPAWSITELYKSRWKIELFFKWIKQHLRIKAFFGTSPNAVKTQIWIAISVYVLIAIIKKRFYVSYNIYSILQILSITSLEKTDILQVLTKCDYTYQPPADHNQLTLFEL